MFSIKSSKSNKSSGGDLSPKPLSKSTSGAQISGLNFADFENEIASRWERIRQAVNPERSFFANVFREFLFFNHQEMPMTEGHPTDFVHYVGHVFLSCIHLKLVNGDQIPAEEYLLSTNSKGNRIESALFNPQTFDNEQLNLPFNRYFLLICHTLSKLLSWRHNVGLLIGLYTPHFFLALTYILDLGVTGIEDSISDATVAVDVTQRQSALLSFTIAICRSLSALSATTERWRGSSSLTVLSDAEMIFSVDIAATLRRLGVDLLATTDDNNADEEEEQETSESTANSPSRSPSKGTPLKSSDSSSKSKKNSGSGPSAAQLQSTTLHRAVSATQRLLRKSLILTTSESECGRNVHILALIVQSEVLKVTATLIAVFPMVAAIVVKNECHRFLIAIYTLGSSTDDGLLRDLYFQRVLWTFRFFRVGFTVEINDAASSWLTETIDAINLSADLMRYLIETSVNKPASDVMTLHNSCQITMSCSTNLGCSFPPNGLFPWYDSKVSAARYIEVMKDGVDEGNEAAVTNSLVKLWRRRASSISTHKVELDDLEVVSIHKHFLVTSSSSQASVTDILPNLSAETEVQMMSALLQVWLDPSMTKSKSFPDIFAAVVSSLLTIVNGYSHSDKRSLLATHLTLRLLVTALQRNSTDTLQVCRREHVIKTLFERIFDCVSTAECLGVIEGTVDANDTYSISMRQAELEQAEGLKAVSTLLQMVTLDCALEFLWQLCSHKQIDFLREDAKSHKAELTFDEEITLLDSLGMHQQASGIAITMVFRWLFSLAFTHSRLNIKSLLWQQVMQRALIILKQHLERLPRPDMLMTGPGGDAFRWPALCAVLKMIGRIMHDESISTDWIEAFVYPIDTSSLSPAAVTIAVATTIEDDSKGGGGLPPMAPPLSSSTATSGGKVIRSNRYQSLFKGCQLEASRRQCAGIIVKVLHVAMCRAVGDKVTPTARSSAEHVTVHEALAHDILKNSFNLIRNFNTDNSIDDNGAGISCLFEGLKLLFRSPESFNTAIDSISLPQMQEVLIRYGTARSAHRAIFFWNHNRPNIVRDLTLCLSSAISNCGEDRIKCTSILEYVVPFFTAMIKGSTQLRSFLFTCTSRTKPVTLMPASITASDAKAEQPQQSAAVQYATIENLSELIVSALIGREKESTSFFGPLVELIIGGLPLVSTRHLSNQLRKFSDGDTSVSIFLDPEARPFVQNAGVLNIVLPLVSYWPDEWQVFAMRSTLQLQQGYWTTVANSTLVSTMKPSLLELIVEIFDRLCPAARQEAIGLLIHLGRFNVSVAEVKKLIRRLRDDPNDPQRSDYLAAVLSESIAKLPEPQFYFFFEGQQSGICLPVFSHFPGTQGYTFMVWIKAEFPSGQAATAAAAVAGNNARSASAVDLEMVLFSVRQVEGVGFEFSLRKLADGSGQAVIIASIYNTVKSSQPVQKELIKLPAQQLIEGWHFIAVSHFKGRFLSKSQIIIVVDDISYQYDLTFPRFTGSDPILAAIGRIHPEVRLQSPSISNTLPVSSNNKMLSFHGKMSSFYMLSSGLTKEALMEVRRLPVKGFHEISSLVTGDSQLKLDASIVETLAIAYNPGVEIGGQVVNNAPDAASSSFIEGIEQRRNGLPMAGFLMPSTFFSTSSDLRNALDSLGGVKVVLPLLEQMVQREHIAIDKVCETLRLLRNALNDTVEARKFMIEIGFMSIVHILNACNPSTLTAAVVDELQMILDRFEDNDGNYTLSFIKTVYLDFNFWVNTPFAAQEQLMKQLEKFCRVKGQTLYQANGVSLLLHSLLFVYSGYPQTRFASLGMKSEQFATIQAWHHSQEALTAEQQSTLRSQLFACIYQLIVHAEAPRNEEDITAIVRYILQESHPDFKIEGLQLLLKLINPEKQQLAQFILQAFKNSSLLFHISTLCHYNRAKVRLYAWLVICNMFALSLSSSSSLLSGATANDVRMAVSFDAEDQQSQSQHDGFKSGFDVLAVAINNINEAQTIQGGGNSSGAAQQQQQAASDYSQQQQLFGVDLSTLSAWFQLLVNETLDEIQKNLCDTESNDLQHALLFHMLFMTMQGKGTKSVLQEIEKVPMPPSDTLKASCNNTIQVPAMHITKLTIEEQYQALICIPMLLPALVKVLGSRSYRGKYRNTHFTCLTNSVLLLDNLDIMWSIPHWQGMFLDLYISIRAVHNAWRSAGSGSGSATAGGAATRRKSRGFSSSSTVGEEEDDYILAKAIAELFGCIHLKCLQFGEVRSTFYQLQTVREVTDIAYVDLPTVQLFEKMRQDNRALGCTSVRKTISYLRSYVSTGQLTYDGFCFTVIRSIVEQLQRGINEIRSYELLSRIDKEMRLKLFEMNVWVVLECVCQYMTMPPMRPASPRATLQNQQSLLITSPKLMRGVSDPKHGENNSSEQVDYYEIASSSGADGQAAAAPMLLSPTQKQRSHSEDNINAHTQPDSNNDKGRNRVESLVPPSSSPIKTIGKVLMTPEIQEQQVTQQQLLGPAMLDGEFIPTALPRNSLADLVVDTQPEEIEEEVAEEETGPKHTERYFQVSYDTHFWTILETLVQMLGINDAFTGSWFTRDRLLRLEAAMNVGFARGRFIIHLVQESVESLLSADTAASTEVPKVEKAQRHQRLLGKVMDHSLWLLLRTILKIGLQGAFDTDLTDSSIAIKALCKLSLLLNWAQSLTKTSFENESLFVLASISNVFHGANAALNPLWSRYAIKLFLEILHAQKGLLATRLNGIVNQFSVRSPSTMFGDFAAAVVHSMSPRAQQQPTVNMSATSIDAMDLNEAYGDGVNNTLPLLSSRMSVTSSNDSFMDVGSTGMTQYLLVKIRESVLAASPYHSANISSSPPVLKGSANNDSLSHTQPQLQSPDTTNNNSTASAAAAITWSDWMSLIFEILRESLDREKEALKYRLDEFGLHQQTEIITDLLHSNTKALQDHKIQFTRKTDSLHKKALSTEQKAMKEYAKSELHNRKHAERVWLRLRDELCSERGPWGTGRIDPHSNTEDNLLWTIGQVEDKYRMKMKLVRCNGLPRTYLNDFLNNMKKASDADADTNNEQDNHNAEGMISSPRKVSAVDLLLSASDEQSVSNNNRSSDDGGDGGSMSDLRFKLSIIRELHQYRAESDSHSAGQQQAADGQDGDDAPAGNDDDDDDDNDEDSEELIADDDEQQPQKQEQELHEEEEIILSLPCEIITPSTNSMSIPSSGMLQLTRKKIIFARSTDTNTRASFSSVVNMNRTRKEEVSVCEQLLWVCTPFPSTTWDVKEIVQILPRYYQLRFVALEIFTTARTTCLFNLIDSKAAIRFHNAVRKLHPPYLQPGGAAGKLKPMQIMKKTLAPNSQLLLTEAWVSREISNFDYLMKLNTIAGRTYNDLGQYPIFPWILADYTSERLDLKDRHTFRDLKWPIGAQDESQREVIQSKYNDLLSVYDPDDENALPPFHYGTHYSVAGFVVWYLMRCEPFTSLHVQLQDGRIDRADRLFDSFTAAWRGCTTNASDAKELIPELFYNPAILSNVNGVDFGMTQGRRQINDIILPPWAKDAQDFIYKHREALESEYVSRHLHHWIDLIFGYKQRPPHLSNGSDACVDSCNVFFHLTYENAVDLDKLKESNPELYMQSISQITEFGQTPCQLFSREHPPRLPLKKVDIIWPIASIVRGVHTVYDAEDEGFGMPRKMLCFKSFTISKGPVVLIIDTDDKLLTVDHQRVLGIHAWQVTFHDAVPPFRLKLDPLLADFETTRSNANSTSRLSTRGLFGNLVGKGSAGRERKIGVPFASDSSRRSTLAITAAPTRPLAAEDPLPLRKSSSSFFTSDSINNKGMNKEALKWRPLRVKHYRQLEDRHLLSSSSSSRRQSQSILPLTTDSVNMLNSANYSASRRNSASNLRGLSPAAAGGLKPMHLPFANMESNTATMSGAPINISSSNHAQQLQGLGLGLGLGSSSYDAADQPSIAGLRTQRIQSFDEKGTGGANDRAGLAISSYESSNTLQTLQYDASLQQQQHQSSKRRSETITSSDYRPVVPSTPSSSSNNTAAIINHALGVNLAVADEHISAKNFAYLDEANGGLLFSCGHWDWSIRVTSVDSGRLLLLLQQHHDVVTCLATCRDYGQRWLVSGSRDCTVIVWEINPRRNGSLASITPLRTLYGHDDTVSSITINPELDLLVSGSEDGTLILYNLRDGQYIRTVNNYQPRPPATMPADCSSNNVKVSKWPSTPSSNSNRSSTNYYQTTSIVSLPVTPAREQQQLGGDDELVLDTSHESIKQPLSALKTESNDYDNNMTAAPPSMQVPSSNNTQQQSKPAAAAVASASSSSSSWPVSWLGISREGFIITYCTANHTLASFTINGACVAMKKLCEVLHCFAISDDGTVLVTGGTACLVAFRWVRNLDLALDGPRKKLEPLLDGATVDYKMEPFAAPIRSIRLTRQERHLVVGLENGEVRILAHDSDYLRERLHSKLQELGIL